eukprot:TRINITY_DN2286_c0_g1_i1.p1 TRINITY_DN2286_c0_g1~~TRINITY_DN2286_c0_g1_i1.p1  ORF type:complete len:521 (+),score=98.51 TRINITY_DN2286_c0_g1_i1:444-2006(+)
MPKPKKKISSIKSEKSNNKQTPQQISSSADFHKGSKRKLSNFDQNQQIKNKKLKLGKHEENKVPGAHIQNYNQQGQKVKERKFENGKERSWKVNQKEKDGRGKKEKNFKNKDKTGNKKDIQGGQNEVKNGVQNVSNGLNGVSNLNQKQEQNQNETKKDQNNQLKDSSKETKNKKQVLNRPINEDFNRFSSPQALTDSNWDKMKSQISNAKPKQTQKRKIINGVQISGLSPTSDIYSKSASDKQSNGGGILDPKGDDNGVTRVLALDCEMVGVGFLGGQSVVARVTIVNDYGNVIYDEHVQPKMRVTDFRTRWSGVRPADLRSAVDFEEMQKKVAGMLEGKILVGHALQNDLKVLQLSHPKRFTRDTSRYPPLMYRKGSRLRPKSLKQLAWEQLQLKIQENEHSSAEDARTALYIYHKFRDTWEVQVRNNEFSGAKFQSFEKRRDPVKDAERSAKKLEQERIQAERKAAKLKKKFKYDSDLELGDGADEEDDITKSRFSFEKMENMQMRMSDPYLDPMADL